MAQRADIWNQRDDSACGMTIAALSNTIVTLYKIIPRSVQSAFPHAKAL